MKRKAKTKNKKNIRLNKARTNRIKHTKRKQPGLKYKGKLTLLLGAGFSKLAGLPLGQEINNKFNRDLRDKLLRNSSSEWSWVDGKSNAEIQNGRMTNHELGYSYIFNELVNRYKVETKEFIDYEDFFSFIVEAVNNRTKINTIYDNARIRMETDYKDRLNDDYLYPFNQYPEILVEIFNYLIADLLKIRTPNEDLIKIYSPIIQKIKWFDDVDIFTLNHDWLMEYLLYLFSIHYCDGFFTQHSNISEFSRTIPTFQYRFNKRSVRIKKLHGSVNCYKLEHTKEIQSSFNRTGKYTYFKTNDYYKKHHAKRIDPISGKTIQQFNPDIVPKFISGKNKKDDILNDKMFSFLYADFEKTLQKSSCILISGYSFGDNHINEHLMHSKPRIVINQNPDDKYPFHQRCINVRTFEDVAALPWGKLY